MNTKDGVNVLTDTEGTLASATARLIMLDQNARPCDDLRHMMERAQETETKAASYPSIALLLLG